MSEKKYLFDIDEVFGFINGWVEIESDASMEEINAKYDKVCEIIQSEIKRNRLEAVRDFAERSQSKGQFTPHDIRIRKVLSEIEAELG